MGSPKESSKQAARLALRLDRRTQNHLSTSYRESRGLSSSSEKENKARPSGGNPSGVGPGSDSKKLSWLDIPDDRWPSDYWVVGADLDPALWPELWTFLAEGGG